MILVLLHCATAPNPRARTICVIKGLNRPAQCLNANCQAITFETDISYFTETCLIYIQIMFFFIHLKRLRAIWFANY